MSKIQKKSSKEVQWNCSHLSTSQQRSKAMEYLIRGGRGGGGKREKLKNKIKIKPFFFLL